MKRSMKTVIALVMMLTLLMPTVSFAADSSQLGQGNLGQVNLEALKQACSKSGTVDLQKIMNLCSNKALLQKTTANCPKKATTTPAKAVAKTPAPAKATPTAPAKATPTVTAPSATGSYESQVAALVNKERAAQGLPALKYNAELAKVAEAKAADLRDKGYFDHNSPTYGSPFDMMKQFGITYRSAGENIAKGQRTPAAVMDGWMNSPGHKANIMNSNFTDIGVGYVTDSNGTGYWVQMFIRP